MPGAPYCAGPPVGNGDAFVGREDIVIRVLRELSNGQGILLLQGQRRIGKTSILDHLISKLRDAGYLPVKLDLQELARANSAEITTALVARLEQALGVGTAPAVAREITFEHSLSALFQRTDRRVVVLIDEFDRVDTYDPNVADRGSIHWMRALEPFFSTKLSLILAYGRYIEQINSDLKGLLKNDGQRIRVSLLHREELEHLVRLSEKCEDSALRWSEAAVDEVWRLTSGHPLLTQAICLEAWMNLVVGRPPGAPVSLVQPQDVMSLANTVVAERSALQLDWLWEGLNLPCQVVALALAQKSPGSGIWMPQSELFDFLLQHNLDERCDDLGLALDALVQWDLIERRAGDDYRFRVELVRRSFQGKASLDHLLEKYRNIPSANELLRAGVELLQLAKNQTSIATPWRAEDLGERLGESRTNSFEIAPAPKQVDLQPLRDRKITLSDVEVASSEPRLIAPRPLVSHSLHPRSILALASMVVASLIATCSVGSMLVMVTDLLHDTQSDSDGRGHVEVIVADDSHGSLQKSEPPLSPETIPPIHPSPKSPRKTTPVQGREIGAVGTSEPEALTIKSTMRVIADRVASSIREQCKISRHTGLRLYEYRVRFAIARGTGDVVSVTDVGEAPIMAKDNCVASEAKRLIPSFAGAVDLVDSFDHTFSVVRE